MRLSESLRKNIMYTGPGRIINTFKINRRRNVLLFEEILARYIKECETGGYNKEIGEISSKLTNLVMNSITPLPLKKLPLTLVLNTITRNVWINLGVLDDLKSTIKDGMLHIKTKNEFICRIIGENEFSTKFVEGIVSVLSSRVAECIRKTQSLESCSYILKLKQEPCLRLDSKPRGVYHKLNEFPQASGFDLKKAVESKFFIIKNNRIFFRGKVLIPMENTIFHLISNANLLKNRISEISHDFFEGIVYKNTPLESRLVMLKNLLQISGWGIVNIIVERNRIKISITNLPFGLQLEKDNWDFLVRFILGFLWTIDHYSIKNASASSRALRIEYSL